MIKFKKCIRCGSEKTDLLFVNTRISLNYPEERSPYGGVISQKTVNPTDALVCKECGHIEFFIDWDRQ